MGIWFELMVPIDKINDLVEQALQTKLVHPVELKAALDILRNGLLDEPTVAQVEALKVLDRIGVICLHEVPFSAN